MSVLRFLAMLCKKYLKHNLRKEKIKQWFNKESLVWSIPYRLLLTYYCTKMKITKIQVFIKNTFGWNHSLSYANKVFPDISIFYLFVNIGQMTC